VVLLLCQIRNQRRVQNPKVVDDGLLILSADAHYTITGRGRARLCYLATRHVSFVMRANAGSVVRFSRISCATLERVGPGVASPDAWL
jgi:hypothetical protein